MKPNRWIWIVCLLLTSAAWATAVENNQFSDLFVKNNAGVTNAATYLVVKEQPEFDRIFGHAAVMWQKHKSAPPDFSKQVVALAVHQGNRYTTYQVQALETSNSVVTIRYTTKVRLTPDTAYACPMILTLPRAGLTAVTFTENGKTVATVKL
ncbi:MAG: hypothetical protein EPN23_10450 [Verrucomicrobia bacterium]|nr:MAG: hypothetical protein EPN23_10450 [Verrucomicrobiota bacterium]